MDEVFEFGSGLDVERLSKHNGKYWIAEVVKENDMATLYFMDVDGHKVGLRLPVDCVDIRFKNIYSGRIEMIAVINGEVGVYGFYEIVAKIGKMGEYRLELIREI